MNGRQRLDEELIVILDGGLGLAVFPHLVLRSWQALRPAKVRKSAMWRGAQIFAAYLMLFYVLPWAVHFIAFSHRPEPSRALLALQIYGAFWAGWSTVTATLASDAVLGILRRDILPRLPDPTCREIAAELAQRYPRQRLLVQSWLIAAAAAALAGLLVYRPGARLPEILEILWWCCGWAILFATSAKVVATATFYRIFSVHLVDALGTRLWLDPVRSELVESIARIGRTILLFWVGIAFSIAIIVPAGLDWTRPGEMHLRDETAAFVAIEASLTGLLSIGIGVLVFLSAEAAIRNAARTMQLRALEKIDAEAAPYIQRLEALDADELKRLSELRSLHAGLAANGPYRSLFIGSLSVLLPFVPLLTFLFTLLGVAPKK